MIKKPVPFLLIALLASGGPVLGGGFIASTSNPTLLPVIPSAITHPPGYSGAGGQVVVSVCIDQTASFASRMVAPTQRAVATWNNLLAATGNWDDSIDNGVGSDRGDFESAVLHELGHCTAGLRHTDISGLASLRDYTTSVTGDNGEINLNPGIDGVRGSSDDVRDDDVNLHWFRVDTNDPFSTMLPSPVDPSTYSVDPSSLPTGHLFAANANVGVAALPAFPDRTQASLNAVIDKGTTLRSLTADDVATVRLAMAGFNEVAGDADDYTILLDFKGVVDTAIVSCDIPIRTGSTGQNTGGKCTFAHANTAEPGHFSILPTEIVMNDNETQWFFGAAPDLKIEKFDQGVAVSPGGGIVYDLAVSNDGDQDALGVIITETIPVGTTFDAAQSPGWSCPANSPGSVCTFALGTVPKNNFVPDVPFAVLVDDPTTVAEVVNTASVVDDGSGAADENPADNVVTLVTPVDVPCGGTEFLLLTAPLTDLVVIHEACDTLTAGTAFNILSGRDVTFKARNLIELTDGFSVESGATFSAELDPLAGQTP